MDNKQYTDTITQRLQSALGDTTYSQLGQLTDTHPETVRRYMNGHAPSAAFLSKVATEFGVSGEWLITGNGPMLSRDIPKYVLNNAQPDVLMNAVAQLVVYLNKRIDAIDQRGQTSSYPELKLNNTSQHDTGLTPAPIERCG